MARIILHVDMNNCYASIEARLNPALKGLPLAVCGSLADRHGIVLAKSQEAKLCGVKTGEAIWQAKLKCPSIRIVPPHYEEYLNFSRRARQVYYQYTNQVEPFGLDECWLDVSGSTGLFGSGETIGQTIRQRIKRELGITVSVGVSFNKVFAKFASDLKKPDAVSLIPQNLFREIVWPRPVEEMIGVGPASKRKLNNIGIFKLGDLARIEPKYLLNLLGLNGYKLWLGANGLDQSPVLDWDARPEIKSLGRGVTCKEDLFNNQEVRNVFLILALELSKSLKDYGFLASSIQISVRDIKLFSCQYQAPLVRPCQSPELLTQAAMALFKARYDWYLPVRSLTLRACKLLDQRASRQIDFFSDYQDYIRWEKIADVMYGLRKRYGKGKASYASLLGRVKIPDQMIDLVTLPHSFVR